MKNNCLILCILSLVSVNLFAQKDSDLEYKFVEFPKVIKQNTSATIKLLVTNLGTDLNKEFIANLIVDDKIIATKNVHINLLHQKSQEIIFTNRFNLPISEHSLKFCLDDKLNSIETEFFVARTTVPQLPLIEEFTSSTCGPCATFNNTFDPFLSSIDANKDGGQVAAVKYQMNWPGPGDDPSYNADGNGRKGSYNVSGIPKTYLNGVAASTFNQSVIDAASGESAFKLIPYFYLSGDTVKATSTVTPYITFSSTLRVHLALTEDFYTYSGGTTSQTAFRYVMRKMLPNYVGTVISSINEDTIYTINKNYKVNYGNVIQNSNNIWGTSAGLTLVSWLQNPSTKEIYQAAIATTPSALNLVENTNNIDFAVYPNPANESFTVKLELNEITEVSYNLFDITGKLIQQPIVQELPAGKHIIQTSTHSLLPGTYICKIKTNDREFSERIIINK